MPTWKRTIPIIVKFLQNLGAPVARSNIPYTDPAGKHTHAIKDCSVLSKMVTLLVSMIAELELMDGNVGTINAIVYRDREEPRACPESRPVYVIVEFPGCTIPDEDALIPGKPSTWIPIPVVILRCEHLRVVKACSIDKSWGSSVVVNKLWERVAVALPPATQQGKRPCCEHTALPRACETEDFAIFDDDMTLTYETFLKIGQRREPVTSAATTKPS